MKGETDLCEALESGFFSLPELPGRLRFLPVPGTRGWISSIDHPQASYAGFHNLPAGSYEEVIDRTCNLFEGEQKAFSWLVGPHAQAAGCAQKLQAAGLRKRSEIAGVVLHNIESVSRTEGKVHVVEADKDQMTKIPALMAATFGCPKRVARLHHDALMHAPQNDPSRAYVAYLDGHSSPIAFSYITYVSRCCVALLRVAGTLPQHRRQGIYTSMVKRRLVDAAMDGFDRAIVLAVRNASGSALHRLGFREICTFDMYEWRPLHKTSRTKTPRTESG